VYVVELTFQVFSKILDPWSKDRIFVASFQMKFRTTQVLVLISKKRVFAATELTEPFSLNCEAKKVDTLLGFPRSHAREFHHWMGFSWDC